MLDPTVVFSAGIPFLTAIIAAFSIKATIEGVEKTGKSPEPTFSAETEVVTTIFDMNVSPISITNLVINPLCDYTKIARFLLSQRVQTGIPLL